MSDVEHELPAREFGWSDMWAAPRTTHGPRRGRPTSGRCCCATCGNYRLTLQMKCAGLDAEQLARRTVPPSNMSLLGLVRHLATVEQYWFRVAMAGERSSASTAARATTSSTTPSATRPSSSEAWVDWRAEVANAEQYVERTPDLDTTGPEGDVLREVLLHMVEEYARHCGHADFLRERIDGRIGQ